MPPRSSTVHSGDAAVPQETISAFARSIVQAARSYGFSRVDTIRLMNALMDLLTQQEYSTASMEGGPEATSVSIDDPSLDIKDWPLRSPRLRIRLADRARDAELIEAWLDDKYGQHFLLCCSTAQRADVSSLLGDPRNRVGIVMFPDGDAIGAVAFLDHDEAQRRAEMRKLIGEPSARGRGFAEEATALWLKYGVYELGLEKIYVSTLQNHLRNIRLNERVGFRIEGVLAEEVLLDGVRLDVLRMGFCSRRRSSFERDDS